MAFCPETRHRAYYIGPWQNIGIKSLVEEKKKNTSPWRSPSPVINGGTNSGAPLSFIPYTTYQSHYKFITQSPPTRAPANAKPPAHTHYSNTQYCSTCRSWPKTYTSPRVKLICTNNHPRWWTPSTIHKAPAQPNNLRWDRDVESSRVVERALLWIEQRREKLRTCPRGHSRVVERVQWHPRK